MPEEEFMDHDDQEAERRRLERQEKLAAKKQQRLLQHVSGRKRTVSGHI